MLLKQLPLTLVTGTCVDNLQHQLELIVATKFAGQR